MPITIPFLIQFLISADSQNKRAHTKLYHPAGIDRKSRTETMAGAIKIIEE